ncbi:MAG: asparagine synthetase B, partial [Sinobacteraceae bacterium]|nr:asparagine synthetase B [Nevskiaceae bacterium]
MAGIGLAHRRLSIIDTSPGARQPMHSPAGYLVVTYNGEIYNFLELREELQRLGIHFRTQSDTEVLVAAFEHWGAVAALKRLVGMFALAIWDARDRSLILARDRAGEKPLYWGLIEHDLYFASELKAFHRIPTFKGSIDCEALRLFCQYAYVPTPRSIYESVYKLPPGHWLRARRTKDGTLRTDLSRYWQLEVSAGAPHCSYTEARE